VALGEHQALAGLEHTAEVVAEFADHLVRAALHEIVDGHRRDPHASGERFGASPHTGG
jgi:hypothetical protein